MLKAIHPKRHPSLKILLPIAMLLTGIAAAWAIVQAPAEVAAKPPKTTPPQVKTLPVKPRTIRLKVHSQGTVRASTESELTAEVSGKVIKVAPGFKEGGFFKKGELLVQIEPQDYDLAITKARAQVTEAHSQLLQEKGNVEVAQKGWEMIDEGKPTPLALGIPQL